jgi:hypothetical protein
VKIEYENLPAVVTIDEAIKNNSFHPLGNDNSITKGHPAEVLAASSVDQGPML